MIWRNFFLQNSDRKVNHFLTGKSAIQNKNTRIKWIKFFQVKVSNGESEIRKYHLIVKSQPQNEDARRFLKPSRTFEKEVQMYGQVRFTKVYKSFTKEENGIFFFISLISHKVRKLLMFWQEVVKTKKKLVVAATQCCQLWISYSKNRNNNIGIWLQNQPLQLSNCVVST